MNTVTKTKCLPTYLVIDTSTSMDGHTELLNSTIENLITTVGDSPRVAEFAHTSIITFNDYPHLVLELTNIEDVQLLPQVTCQGTTDFGRMFHLLRQRIDLDVSRLVQGGRHDVLRPTVFLLTDGEPTDGGWEAAYSAAVGRSWRRHPHIIAFGFGQANESVLARIATKGAFLAEDVADKEAITSMLSSLLNTLLASASAQELQLPVEVPGYRSVPLEYMD